MYKLLRIPEPLLEFGHGQILEDPRDGLTLFGSLDPAPQYGVRAGVIGTASGIQRFERWAHQIQKPVGLSQNENARPPFPGFEATFHASWDIARVSKIQVDAAELLDALNIGDAHQRVHTAVSLYAEPILGFLRAEEEPVDLWFVIIPGEVYKRCRPRSHVRKSESIKVAGEMSPRLARRIKENRSLFEELNKDAVPYQFEPNFRHQLKGRLLGDKVATQVIREPTIAFREFRNKSGHLAQDLSKMESAIAWNIATTAFYKTGGRPWKLAAIREGVCYLGLVFKLDERGQRRGWACCAAKMFLDSGDGIVFRGALGPWYSTETREFHLSELAAMDLMKTALTEYKLKRGSLPQEVFIHGKVRFGSDEWRGFQIAAGREVKLVGVRIREDATLRLFKGDRNTVLRGLAFVRDQRTAYLWTRGFVPRIQTYAGREVPVPLVVDICRGEADTKVVLQDIMALTKLNYNTCVFADGIPVTLRFADAVGEILTAGPLEGVPPLPFKYYI
jgi:hypothetical protein